MCGITGWIDWERDLTHQRPVLDAMTNTLAPRGPDACGRWLSARAALGHRRLIVVDPQGGSQPMLRYRGPDLYVITYNGELYNTPELTAELTSRGHRFAGHSDTEALLAAFIEWGPQCLERLNGIFAFGIWDEARQRLVLARDRLGVKPLFWARRGDALVFGSEIKALLAHPAIHPEIDAEGLAEIFAMGPARTPGCGVFRGISELRPGQYLIHTRSGTVVRSYWTLRSAEHADDLKHTAETVHDLLQDTVQRQLVADVPVCTLLSGGLDSSAITALAAKALDQAGAGALATYSVEYRDNEQYFAPNALEPSMDAPWVEVVSRHCGTAHHCVILDAPELADSLQPAALARDLPGMADIDGSLLLFSAAVKEQATVALSGESADEVFGGYPWFRRPEALAARAFPWSTMVSERSELLQPDIASAISAAEYAADRYAQAVAEVPRLAGEGADEQRMRVMSYLNITRFMPTLLDRKDRMSMATGLEVRVPFCDHRLVEYVWNIPWSMKSCDGQPKGILRRALAGLLPQAVLERRKSPYPKTHDPSYLSMVRQRCLRLLDDATSPLLALIDVSKVRAVAQGEDPRFTNAWFSQLMREAQLYGYLLQIDAWMRAYHVRVTL